ncbi:MAG: hypothetical protein EBZ18_00185, partial [Alphaproteobacteria bacterium]|nr:hypothetical protein [Alphaproteobacteria bacterium]
MKSGPYLLMLGSVVTAGIALGIFLYSTSDEQTADNVPGGNLTVEGQKDSSGVSSSTDLSAANTSPAPTANAVSQISTDENSTSDSPASTNEEARSDIEIGINLARVRQDGTTVIAGQAIANSTINLLRDGKIIGTTFANEAGEWVIVPDIQLEEGSHLLSVEIITPEGERIISPMAVVIDMPNPPDNSSSTNDGTPLVALVPYTDEADQATRVLQAPDENALSATSAPASDQKNNATTATTSTSASASPTTPSVWIRIIQALSRDQLAVSGNSGGGSAVTVQVNSTTAAADLDDTGMFYAAVNINPEAEVFNLRVELKDENGNVLARASLKLSQAQIEQTQGNNSLVVVHRGDALWRIAYRTYGEGIRYVDIYRKNQKQIDDPDLIYPDQI